MDEENSTLAEEINELTQRLDQARLMIARQIIGQDFVINMTLAAMLAGGHALLLGVPGVGKTRLVETLSKVMGLSSNRIQFTPDLMPADIIGSEILQTEEDGKRRFRFAEGPVFCQLLMADEINRASPRTQSALLQAMQENEITVAGLPFPLPAPFLVLATQNPIELEGTYPLPEAQLDRFMLRIEVGYPDRISERKIVEATTGAGEQSVSQVLTGDQLLEAQRIVRRMPVGDSVVEAILDLVRACRPNDSVDDETDTSGVEWGPGPRASQSLMLSVRAHALLGGRLAPSLEDIRVMAKPALCHRMALGFAARSKGQTVEDVVDDMVESVIGRAQAGIWS